MLYPASVSVLGWGSEGWHCGWGADSKFDKMLYFGVVGALAISVIDHYECVHFCKECPTNSTDVDNRDLCSYVRVPFWVLLAMSALAVAFILISCVCCVSRSCKNVRISIRRETQRSVEHY